MPKASSDSPRQIRRRLKRKAEEKLAVPAKSTGTTLSSASSTELVINGKLKTFLKMVVYGQPSLTKNDNGTFHTFSEVVFVPMIEVSKLAKNLKGITPILGPNGQAVGELRRKDQQMEISISRSGHLIKGLVNVTKLAQDIFEENQCLFPVSISNQV